MYTFKGASKVNRKCYCEINMHGFKNGLQPNKQKFSLQTLKIAPLHSDIFQRQLLNNKSVFLTVMEAEKSQKREVANSVYGEGLFSYWQPASLCTSAQECPKDTQQGPLKDLTYIRRSYKHNRKIISRLTEKNK